MGSSLSVVYYFKGNAVAWTSDYNGLTIVSIGFEGKRIKEQLTDLGFFFFFFKAAYKIFISSLTSLNEHWALSYSQSIETGLNSEHKCFCYSFFDKDELN